MGSKSDDEIVRLELGFDRFEAQIIAAACTDAGLAVELLLMDESGNTPGRMALQPHCLLVRASELEEVRAILSASGH